MNNTTTQTNNTKKKSRVRIELYASNLKNVAGAFKGTSDPYAVVTRLPTRPTESPTVIGKTEVYVEQWNECAQEQNTTWCATMGVLSLSLTHISLVVV